MKHLLNTLYVLTEGAYLSLDGENVVVSLDKNEIGRVPLHMLEGIVSFSFSGASPGLMGACAERGIALSFFDYRGRFLACVHGEQRGNVLLRKTQYAWSAEEEKSLAVAKNCIAGKLYNSRWVLERTLRDHGMRVDNELVKGASSKLAVALKRVRTCNSIETLRGIEGAAASDYYSAFDEMILRDKERISFHGRKRRPPTDPVNAMLSLFYTVLAKDCASALEGVGLDSYVGFLHTDRPGRQSLALDMMEELRPIMVDRFVLSAINNRIVEYGDFVQRETGEVRIGDDARRKLFKAWQDKKQETIMHPFVREKIPWGLTSHVQALLLARYMRGDLDAYPPFFWK